MSLLYSTQKTPAFRLLCACLALSDIFSLLPLCLPSHIISCPPLSSSLVFSSRLSDSLSSVLISSHFIHNLYLTFICSIRHSNNTLYKQNNELDTEQRYTEANQRRAEQNYYSSYCFRLFPKTRIREVAVMTSLYAHVTLYGRQR